MSDIKTVPCPICGSANISDGEVLTQFKNGICTKQSVCEDCGAEGPHAILAEGEVDYGDVKAIAAWNAWATSIAAPASSAIAMQPSEPVAWRNFDGEGGYTYTDNDATADAWRFYNGEKYANWLEPLYAAPQVAQPSAEAMPETVQVYMNRGRKGWEISGTVPDNTSLHPGINTLYTTPPTVDQSQDVVAMQPVDAKDAAEGFYLASFKRRGGLVTWWGPNNAGYTPYLDQAGIYKKSELISGYHDSDETVPVPCDFVDQFIDRLVDSGMTKCGEIFWNAHNLRAAIAASKSQSSPSDKPCGEQ